MRKTNKRQKNTMNSLLGWTLKTIENLCIYIMRKKKNVLHSYIIHKKSNCQHKPKKKTKCFLYRITLILQKLRSVSMKQRKLYCHRDALVNVEAPIEKSIRSNSSWQRGSRHKRPLSWWSRGFTLNKETDFSYELNCTGLPAHTHNGTGIHKKHTDVRERICCNSYSQCKGHACSK